MGKSQHVARHLGVQLGHHLRRLKSRDQDCVESRDEKTGCLVVQVVDQILDPRPGPGAGLFKPALLFTFGLTDLADQPVHAEAQPVDLIEVTFTDFAMQILAVKTDKCPDAWIESDNILPLVLGHFLVDSRGYDQIKLIILERDPHTLKAGFDSFAGQKVNPMFFFLKQMRPFDAFGVQAKALPGVALAAKADLLKLARQAKLALGQQDSPDGVR